MKLICLQDYKYGTKPRMTAKAAKELELDPKDFNGGFVQEFTAGESYDVEDTLAKRLLRDLGPLQAHNHRFDAADPRDLTMFLLEGRARLTMRDALDRGFVVAPEDAGPAQSKVVDPVAVA